MTSSSKAVIRDAITVGASDERALAPRGEYEVDCRGDCVGLCRCNDRRMFTLSIDAFIQHLNEGRIAYI